jgi:hypothetical protein
MAARIHLELLQAVATMLILVYLMVKLLRNSAAYALLAGLRIVTVV